MIRLSLREIADVTGGRLHGDGARTVDHVATDSRTLPAGDALFVALRGESADGHDHLGSAVEAGVAGALVERLGDAPHAVQVDDTWQALRRLAAEVRVRVAPRAVAITGSVGKTTVKDLAAAAIGAQRRTVAAVGSFNNELGVPLTLLGLEADSEVLVAEIGARHVGDIADLAPMVAPDVSIVTAVAGVHLEIFGTIDDIARAKRELVEALRPDGMAVLNGADPRVRAMASVAPRHLLVGGPGADVSAVDVRLDDDARPRFTARTPWGEVAVRVPVSGRHQIANALFALTAAGHLGVDLEAAAAGIAGARVSRWRGDVRRAAGVTVLDDAYNANPTSVLAALETLTTLRREPGRAIAVLGMMAEIGDGHLSEHERIGRAAAELGIDHLVVVGDEAAPMAAGAREVGGLEVSEVTDAAAASELVRSVTARGDVVLVKASRVAGLETVASDLVGDDGPSRSAGGAP